MAENRKRRSIAETFEAFMVEVWDADGLIYDTLNDAVPTATKVFNGSVSPAYQSQITGEDALDVIFPDKSCATIDLTEEGIGKGVRVAGQVLHVGAITTEHLQLSEGDQVARDHYRAGPGEVGGTPVEPDPGVHRAH